MAQDFDRVRTVASPEPDPDHARDDMDNPLEWPIAEMFDRARDRVKAMMR